MKKYILKTNGDFLHSEGGFLVTWHNMNPVCLCAFDSIAEAKEIIAEYELENVSIRSENFSESFFD